MTLRQHADTTASGVALSSGVAEAGSECSSAGYFGGGDDSGISSPFSTAAASPGSAVAGGGEPGRESSLSEQASESDAESESEVAVDESEAAEDKSELALLPIWIRLLSTDVSL